MGSGSSPQVGTRPPGFGTFRDSSTLAQRTPRPRRQNERGSLSARHGSQEFLCGRTNMFTCRAGGKEGGREKSVVPARSVQGLVRVSLSETVCPLTSFSYSADSSLVSESGPNVL